MTNFPHQLLHLESKAKSNHCLLVRFPNLQQITLQLHWDHHGNLPNYLQDCRDYDKVEWIVRSIQKGGMRYYTEIHNFMQPRHRLLAHVEKRMDIKSEWQGQNECKAMVTSRGTEVKKAKYAGTGVWKAMLDDAFTNCQLPTNNWRTLWKMWGKKYED